MELSSFMAMNLQSLQQTLAMSNLNRAMQVEAEGAASLIQSMEQANPQQSLNPAIGATLDVQA
ncbi:putative motility protein [Sinanaerobacter sp. ZZT-01]|uniref:putative motility protein n=1 Tax=Sinanaerobacter sp. ZZT-01 TaxID=3111540 RepID=UPI002D7A07F5|nr:putative motility protein [Sinanaerobacter sp. ZZT-01]WRR93548.1 putative motility protein [Sinanaerobacter sp. ZZT-01]